MTSPIRLRFNHRSDRWTVNRESITFSIQWPIRFWKHFKDFFIETDTIIIYWSCIRNLWYNSFMHHSFLEISWNWYQNFSMDIKISINYELIKLSSLWFHTSQSTHIKRKFWKIYKILETRFILQNFRRLIKISIYHANLSKLLQQPTWIPWITHNYQIFNTIGLGIKIL